MIHCPHCGKKFEITGAMKNQALHEIISLGRFFVPKQQLFFEYALLRIGTRNLANSEMKLARILEELKALWETGRFSYKHKIYTISRDGIAEALKATCGRDLRGPLPNNNYLKSVMVQIAVKEAEEAGRVREKELMDRERQQRSSGVRAGEHEGEKPLPPEEAKGKVRELLSNLAHSSQVSGGKNHGK